MRLPPPEEIRRSFERDGVVVLPDFLPASEVEQLQTEIERYHASVLATSSYIPLFERDNFKKFEIDVIPWFPCEEGNASFLAQRDTPALRQVTEACIGKDYYDGYCLVMLGPARGKGQSWHQDCAPDNPAHYNLNRLFYTHDVTPERGALVVVPGSHRMGRIPSGGNQEPLDGEVALTPKAGTLVLLHGHVYHRVTPSFSDQPRFSVNFRAYAQGTPAELDSVAVYRLGSYDFRTGEIVAPAPVAEGSSERS